MVHLDQSLADQFINEALRDCAKERFQGNVARATQEIQRGNCDVCGAVADCLARQVGAYLGQMDRTVKAVFRYQADEATPRPTLGKEVPQPRKAGINLVAWVARRSAASTSLGTTLESVLADRRKKLSCPRAVPACYVLDIQMVEDGEVQELRGQAAVLSSLLLRTTQLWKRTEAEEQPEQKPAVTRILSQATLDPEAEYIEGLLRQADAIEKLPGGEKAGFAARLEEIKVDLIRRLLSDQPRYIEVARAQLKIGELAEVLERKIGPGQVGGEAAGLVLAASILKDHLREELHGRIRIPESIYLGADLLYTFMAMNRLMHWNYQKYKPDEQIRSEYPLIRQAFQAGSFPADILDKLRQVLVKFKGKPLIVRSSSLLEDSFGSAFAGKYEFMLCPNQGGIEEALKDLVAAIASVYASTLCPEALLYRRIRGLRDSDERMGILIQPVQGEQLGRYFLPVAAGVALSRNLFRWAPQIRWEDGFARMVWGLGTGAVERASNNPPRLVGLSHPTLQPQDPTHPDWSFSQKMVDVIDLQDNRFKSLPVGQVISPNYPPVRLIAQRREDGYFTTLRGRVLQADIPQLGVTLHELLRRTDFAPVLSELLGTLEHAYQAPVDVGFTARVVDPEETQPEVELSVLHCRRQDYLAHQKPPAMLELPGEERTCFRTRYMVPRGFITGIRQVIFVSPEAYDRKGRTPELAGELRMALYELNEHLAPKQFICMGPGQWGAIHPRQGVFVSYADIHNSAALVELYTPQLGLHPDPALGTYAFQDLMEAAIYPLTVSLGQAGSSLNRAFLYDTPNHLAEIGGFSPALEGVLRLIDVADYAPGCCLEIAMDDTNGQAVAYFQPDETQSGKEVNDARS